MSESTWLVGPSPTQTAVRTTTATVHPPLPEPRRMNSGSAAHTPVFQWVRGELIGKGSYGKVYLALNATTGEVMAVKQVEKPRTKSDRVDQRQLDVIQALKFESDTLSDLEHSNIVQYLGYEENENHLSIFLEYVPGGTIGSCLLNHGPFSEDVVKLFTDQILAGLEYLHSRKILHRDLKSENILVEPTGNCKISDFGISKQLGSDMAQDKAFTELRGTLFWMAPEVVDSKKKGYDSKVDIWSVGCVVLEMWSGLRPWSGQQAIPVMVKLYKDKVAPPVPPGIDLSPLAHEFRLKCFSVDPKLRPSASELRRHPYLVPAKGWQFHRSEIESISVTVTSERTRDTNGHTTVRPTDFQTPYENESTPIQGSSSSLWNFRRPDDAEEATFRPSVSLRDPGPSRSPPNPNLPVNGPPLVYIQPPGPPSRNSSIYGSSFQSPDPYAGPSNTSPSSRSGKLKNKKSFYVANPDPENPGRQNFRYEPPPLPASSSSHHIRSISSPMRSPGGLSPETPGTARQSDYAPLRAGTEPQRSLSRSSYRQTRRMASSNDLNRNSSRYSTNRFAASADQLNNDEDDRDSRTWQVGGSAWGTRTSTSRPRVANTSDDSLSGSEESDSDSGTLWAKPPSDITKSTPQPPPPPLPHVPPSLPRLKFDPNVQKNGAPSPTTPRKPNKHRTRLSVFEAKRKSTLPRPFVEDVYDHLQEYFPEHNLDKPVVGESSQEQLHDRKKSIRMVAQEQARHRDRLSRRSTKVWGVKMQELKS